MTWKLGTLNFQFVLNSHFHAFLLSAAGLTRNKPVVLQSYEGVVIIVVRENFRPPQVEEVLCDLALMISQGLLGQLNRTKLGNKSFTYVTVVSSWALERCQNHKKENMEISRFYNMRAMAKTVAKMTSQFCHTIIFIEMVTHNQQQLYVC